SDTIFASLKLDVFETWVPPQSSLDIVSLLFENETTRTLSPYFSPNSAIAPDFLAVSISIISVLPDKPSLIHSFIYFSVFLISSFVKALENEKSNLVLFSSTQDPA